MRERQREVQLYRGQMPSRGRPTVAWREDRVRFWAAVGRGLKTEDAAREACVSIASADDRHDVTLGHWRELLRHDAILPTG